MLRIQKYTSKCPVSLGSLQKYRQKSNNVPTCIFESIIDQFTPIPEASCFDPVGQAIPLKLKQKIWEGKFIKMSLLLKYTKEIDEALRGQGELLSDGRLRVVDYRPSTLKWTSAFIVFMSIMFKK
jgi:hypothetical protein